MSEPLAAVHTAIPSALTYRESLALAALAAGKRVLEVGALLGYSTVLMARTARVVHSVDPHEGYPHNDPKPTLAPFMENIAPVRNKVVVHVGYDSAVLPVFEHLTFGLAFLDLTGLYDDTYAAMYRAWPLLTQPGGVLAVHDCGHADWPGVEQAIINFTYEQGVTYYTIDRLAVIPLYR